MESNAVVSGDVMEEYGRTYMCLCIWVAPLWMPESKNMKPSNATSAKMEALKSANFKRSVYFSNYFVIIKTCLSEIANSLKSSRCVSVTLSMKAPAGNGEMKGSRSDYAPLDALGT